MNTPEQLLSDSAEKLAADGTLIPRASQMTPAPLPTPVAGRRRWHFVVFIFLVSLGEIALLFSLLRDVPSDLLRQEFEGLGRVVCVLAYVGTFMWHVSRGLAEDARQAEVPNPIETLVATRTLSQKSPRQVPSGNTTRGYKPAELRT